MNFNPQQEQAIFSEKPLVVISAGAGSGKTRVLTERFVHICEQKLLERLGKKHYSPIGATVDEIVAITFTEKAAREMKDRIRGRIENMRATCHERYNTNDVEVAQKYWQEQKEALDTALITTFHSFCHKLLHEYAFEAEVPPNFTVLDDVQAKLIQIDIFDEMFDSPEYHRKWRPLYNYYTIGQLKEAIKAVYSQMKEIITSVSSIEDFFDSDLIIQLQLAATEETRKEVLIEFYKAARPYVMDLDEENKGIKEITDHFSEVSDVSFENPSNLYLALEAAMPKRTSKKWLDTDPSLYELYEQLYKPLKDTWKKLKGPSEEEIEEVKEIIHLFAHMLGVFHVMYDEAKRERAAMDFSDLQQKAIAILENEQIQLACRKKYRHMMVDEFQDTNQLQMNMLEFIKPNYQFVVGDGKQSIYRFRGADVSLMKRLVDFSQRDKQSQFIDMSTNYRTCEGIIEFVNSAFHEIMGEEASGPSYKIHYSHIQSHRNGALEQMKRVELITLPEDEGDAQDEENELQPQTEYEVIVNRMIEMMKEKRELVYDNDHWREPQWRDFAILIQTRTKLPQLEKALKNKKVPYTVYGGIGFYDKQEIRDMLNILQWLNRPWEPLYILALLRSPLFGVTVEDFLTVDEGLEEKDLAQYIYSGEFLQDERLDETLSASLNKLKKFYENWVPYTPQAPIKEYLQQLFEDSGLKTMLLLQRNNLQLVKNVEKLVAVLSQFQSASLDELLNQVNQLAALSDKEGEAEVELAEGNMVHIMTVHASKGLEFPIVFLPDLAKGPRGDSGSIRFDKDVRIVVQYEKEKDSDPLKSPDKKSSPSFERMKQIAKNQAIEEAKRLFYVAVTRAKDYLVLSTVDKPANDSWYDMLLKSSEQNPQLQNSIIEISQVDKQEEWTGKGERYEPPVIIDRQSSPIIFSVSEIMIFINDPLDYFYKYIIKVDEDWLKQPKQKLTGNEVVSGAKLGTIVHRACELLDNGYPLSEAKSEAMTLLEDEIDQIKYKDALDELIEKYQQVEQLNLGQTVENEWAFSVDIEGAQVIGEIDKIVEKNGSYHIIDLKTNRSQDYDQLLDYYTPQLYLYKMAFEEKYGQTVDQLSFFFMRGGIEGFCTIEFKEAMEERIRTVIKQMIDLKQRKASKLVYENLVPVT